MNDKKEILHALESTVEILRGIYESPCLDSLIQSMTKSHTIDISTDELKEVAKIVLDKLDGDSKPPIYVACFSEDEDSLSQWRAYGGGQGISISFDTSMFEEKNRMEEGRLSSVVYCDEVDRDEINGNIMSIIGDYFSVASFLVGDYSDNMKTLERSLLSFLAKFKHEAFRDEKEWRIIDTSDRNALFRVRGSALVPYVALRNGKKCLPVVKVTVGPGFDQELTRLSVRNFLNRKGYNDIKVCLSKAPYRSF